MLGIKLSAHNHTESNIYSILKYQWNLVEVALCSLSGVFDTIPHSIPPRTLQHNEPVPRHLPPPAFPFDVQ